MRKLFLVLFISLFLACIILSQTPGTEPRKSIKVTYPQKGQIIIVSTMCVIVWEKKGNLNDKVRIVLLKSTGEKVLVIAKATNNSGMYGWRVPNETPEGSYRIRVHAGPVAHRSKIFSIKTPTFIPYEPHLNETLTVGTVKTIRWHSVYAKGTSVYIMISMRKVNGVASGGNTLTYNKVPGDKNSYDWLVGKYWDGTKDLWTSQTDLSMYLFTIRVGVKGSNTHSFVGSSPQFYIKK